MPIKEKIPEKLKYIVGVDEVGRGPLAGPVAVGALVFKISDERTFLPAVFRDARDSKELSPLARERWFKKIHLARRNGELDLRVAFVGAKKIDDLGITRSVSLAIRRAIRRLGVDPRYTLVLLDGGLKAPEHFLFQKTIIGGDRREPIISLASIAAKVLRDKKMCRLAKLYPEFGFEKHKGYGSSFHIKKIKEKGICELHRRSFVKNFFKS